MSLLWPQALVLLGFIPGIVALYFLKLKRPPQVVSSTYLWTKALDSFRVNRPFERFQNQLLLWLQVLAVAALAFAAGRPLLEASLAGSAVHIFLVDCSASMSTLEEGGRSRLELARARLERAILGKTPSDRMMLVAFSDRAQVLAPLTSDPSRLRQGLARLGPTARPTRIREAWETALAAARQFDNSDVYVLSDGGFEPLQQLTQAHASVHYVPIGSARPNRGLTRLQARRNAEGALELFAGVFSRGGAGGGAGGGEAAGEGEAALVELRVDGRLADAKRVTLADGAETGVVFERPGTETGVAELTVTGGDALAADDRAWLPLAASENLRVRIEGEPDPFLEQVLGRNPEVVLVGGAGDAAGPAAPAEIVVYSRRAPPPEGTGGGGVEVVVGVPEGREVEAPAVVGVERDHPLTRHANFANLHVARARFPARPPWMRPLVRAAEGALISAGELGKRRQVAIDFALADSDWPLRTSFPLFFADLVRWVRESEARSYRPGEAVVLRAGAAPAAATRAVLSGPGGERRIDLAERRTLEAGTPGVYRLRLEGSGGTAGGGGESLFTVSLLDARESDTAVRAGFEMGGTEVRGRVDAELVKRELWRPVAWLALALLAVEWGFYQLGRRG